MTVAEPTTTVRTGCPLDCPDACSLDVEVVDGRLARVDGAPEDATTAGFVCGKVRRIGEHVYGEERLLVPMVRRGAKGEGLFEPVEWDEALDLVAERLLAARASSGGASILPLNYGGSNGLLTDGATDLRLFRRLGASELQRTICAVPTSMASHGLFGGMPGVAFEDFEHARLIVVWGTNPNASGIHQVPFVDRAIEAGAQLVVVDPRRTPLARRADLHLAVRPGSDVAVALAVHRHLFETGAADLEFLAEHTTGAEELRRRASEWTVARAAEVAGIGPAALTELCERFAAASPALVRCGWGLERNRNGGSAAAAVLALAAVGGKYGPRGGGHCMSSGSVWPFDRSVVADAPPPGARWVNQTRVARALTEPDGAPVDVLFVYDHNPLMTVPDQERFRRGLAREDLFTVVYDQVLTDTARYADVVLPATTFLEHDELHRGYGVPRLRRIRPAIAPVGSARPNHAVFADLCRRTGVHREGDPETPEELVRALVGTLPDADRVQAELDADGAANRWPAGPPRPMVDVRPGTPDGRIHLVPAHLDRAATEGLYTFRPDPATAAHPLALVSPALARLTTSTFGQLIRGEVALQIHPDDAAARGVADGDAVRVFNDLGEVVVAARVTDEVRPGTLCLPKGLWSRHTRNGATSNALCPDHLTDLGEGACYNDARVEVERAG